MNKLLHLLEEFVEEKNASWNHEDWLQLLSKVKSLDINIEDSKLGEILENEKSVYLAKNQGLNIISKSKLINLCRKFIKNNSANYTESEWQSFLNKLSSIGYYNSAELNYHIEIEKLKLEKRKENSSLEKEKEKNQEYNIENSKKNIKKLIKEESFQKDKSEIENKIHKLTEISKKLDLFEIKLNNRESVLEKQSEMIEIKKNELSMLSKKLIKKEKKISEKESELVKKDDDLEKRESEIKKGKEHLDILKAHYLTELDKLKKAQEEIEMHMLLLEKIKRQS